MNPIVIDPVILRQAGPTSAVIHAVLVANDSGDGAVMTHREIAQNANTTVITARRSIEKLREIGFLKSESQVKLATGQMANRYQIPTVAITEPPAHIEQPCRERDLHGGREQTQGSNTPIRNVLDLSNSRSPSGKPATSDHESDWGPTDIWMPIGSPMPVAPRPKFGYKYFFDLFEEALWLVSHVEGYVLARRNEERRLRGWKPQESISDHRKLRWLDNAEQLLADKDLAEVVQVVDWLFIDCKGSLPFDVVDQYGWRRRDLERKVTNVRKILDNYDKLRESKTLGQTEHVRKERFNKPLVDSTAELKVTELVNMFADFRLTPPSSLREIHPSVSRRWAQQFRRLLIEHEIAYERLKFVVTTLKECRSFMDIRRYPEPADLRRDAQEWDYVQRSAEVARMEAQINAERSVQEATVEDYWSEEEDEW